LTNSRLPELCEPLLGDRLLAWAASDRAARRPRIPAPDLTTRQRSNVDQYGYRARVARRISFPDTWPRGGLSRAKPPADSGCRRHRASPRPGRGTWFECLQWVGSWLLLQANGILANPRPPAHRQIRRSLSVALFNLFPTGTCQVTVTGVTGSITEYVTLDNRADVLSTTN
jgi:hypothetical protein